MSRDGLSISIIIPTIGRPSLRLLLEDIVPQLEPQDEIILIADGYCQAARDAIRGLRVIYLEHNPPANDWGHSLRNQGMDIATGDYLYSIDDDDKFLPGALGVIRSAVSKIPGRPHIFRKRYLLGHLWQEKKMTHGNISTQMVVVPNVRGKLGSWGNSYSGDWDFITQTEKFYPEGYVWNEEFIVHHGNKGERFE